jgi:hypothetical protein
MARIAAVYVSLISISKEKRKIKILLNNNQTDYISSYLEDFNVASPNKIYSNRKNVF